MTTGAVDMFFEIFGEKKAIYKILSVKYVSNADSRYELLLDNGSVIKFGAIVTKGRRNRMRSECDKKGRFIDILYNSKGGLESIVGSYVVIKGLTGSSFSKYSRDRFYTSQCYFTDIEYFGEMSLSSKPVEYWENFTFSKKDLDPFLYFEKKIAGMRNQQVSFGVDLPIYNFLKRIGRPVDKNGDIALNVKNLKIRNAENIDSIYHDFCYVDDYKSDQVLTTHNAKLIFNKFYKDIKTEPYGEDSLSGFYKFDSFYFSICEAQNHVNVSYATNTNKDYNFWSDVIILNLGDPLKDEQIQYLQRLK